MVIDIVFIVLMLAAIARGMQRGLIVAIFSVLACIIGLAAAIKLSAVVAMYLKDDAHLHSKWLPILAFVLVFSVVVLLVRWIANMIETAIDFAMMEWLNKLGGIMLYAGLFIAVYSILLFYGARSHILSPHAIATSRVYGSIAPWGPKIIDEVAVIIPIFRNMFKELETFFAGVAG